MVNKLDNAELPQDNNYRPIDAMSPVATVSVAVTGSTGKLVSIGPGIVRLYGSADFHFKVGDKDVAATTNDTPCTAKTPEYFNVRAGEILAVILQDGASDGIVWASLMG